MWFGIISLFPDMFKALTDYGVVGRAVHSGKIALSYYNPRDYTSDRRKTVDDRPFGGGPGMIMQADPLQSAIDAARQRAGNEAKLLYLSPQGCRLDQHKVRNFAQHPCNILLCGRYEGIDQRIIDQEVDEEISVGDYVLSGGELAAMVLIDSIARWVPGVLGHKLSASEDSFSQARLDHPHYTRPRNIEGASVPAVLLSGDHDAIRRWRLQQSLGQTWRRRPDLLAQLELNPEQKQLLQEFIDAYRADA